MNAAFMCVALFAPAADLVVLGNGAPVRVELAVEVGGKPLAELWGETFAKMSAFYDRNEDGWLDEKEAARLPSAFALREAMAVGFAAAIGKPVAWGSLDRDGDGKATPDEVADFYRAAGVGEVAIGVGRLPAGEAMTDAILKHVGGAGGEAEWRSAAAKLQSLDRNDDELVGAGELVAGALYPGAAGTTPLVARGGTAPELVAKLPLARVPKTGDGEEWRKLKPVRWAVALGKPVAHSTASGGVRFEVRTGAGKLPEAHVAAATFHRKAFVEGAEKNPAELDRWLALQECIAAGQVMLTVLDGGGLFELLDANHDGELSAREARGAWGRIQEAGCVSDGKFDRAKLPRVLVGTVTHGYPASGAVAKVGPAWFAAMDRNGDGDVSRREFTGPADVFEKFDGDKDGLLSAAEAEKAPAK